MGNHLAQDHRQHSGREKSVKLGRFTLTWNEEMVARTARTVTRGQEYRQLWESLGVVAQEGQEERSALRARMAALAGEHKPKAGKRKKVHHHLL